MSDDAVIRKGGEKLRNVGIKTSSRNNVADDKALEDERTTFTSSGKQVPGFASSQVPTLEEKTIMERRPPGDQAEEKPILDGLEDDPQAQADAPDEAEVQDGSHQKYGAPADAMKDDKTDNQPPHARSRVEDATSDEEEAVGARKIIRQHLNAKVGSKFWTLPTSGPDVDPHGFADPVCDKFWKNVWVASAVHNVGDLASWRIHRSADLRIPD